MQYHKGRHRAFVAPVLSFSLGGSFQLDTALAKRRLLWYNTEVQWGLCQEENP